MTKHLIILRGVPGCGKSTVAELLADMGVTALYGSREGVLTQDRPVKICCADDFFMKNGKYVFNPAALGIAHKTCQDKCEKAMIAGDERVIVANTSTTEKELKTYMDLAEKYGYMAISLIVENRHGGSNVHGVPAEALDKMVDRFSIKLR
jgi:predicted kinase